MSDTIAFVATYISSAEDTSKVSFHPTLKFLANWLETEERAVTSHQIGSELVTCAKAAQSLADKELFARFLAGFYKATNDEQPARPGWLFSPKFTKTSDLTFINVTLIAHQCVNLAIIFTHHQSHYFTKTDLVPLSISVLSSKNLATRDMAHQILIEYLVFIQGKR